MRGLLHLYPQGDAPSNEVLSELTYGPKYISLRQAANKIMRDLKNRFFREILLKFKKAKVADAIEKGALHDATTLFQSPWTDPGEEGTIFVEYGESNRKEDEVDGKKKKFSIPALNQHLPMWSETTTSQSLITGRTTNLPYVGSNLLEGYIKELTVNGKYPSIDSLAVFVAYAMAKEFDINVNHGFNLPLAAQEWKTWCVQLSLPALSSRPLLLSLPALSFVS